MSFPYGGGVFDGQTSDGVDSDRNYPEHAFRVNQHLVNLVNLLKTINSRGPIEYINVDVLIYTICSFSMLKTLNYIISKLVLN